MLRWSESFPSTIFSEHVEANVCNSGLSLPLESELPDPAHAEGNCFFDIIIGWPCSVVLKDLVESVLAEHLGWSRLTWLQCTSVSSIPPERWWNLWVGLLGLCVEVVVESSYFLAESELCMALHKVKFKSPYVKLFMAMLQENIVVNRFWCHHTI